MGTPRINRIINPVIKQTLLKFPNHYYYHHNHHQTCFLSSFRSFGRDVIRNSPLEQIRRRYPGRGHLMDLIWRGRSTPNVFQRSDLQVIRKRQYTRQSSIPSGNLEGQTKKMFDSFLEVTLPFSRDANLRDEYASIHGGLRFGKIMEDLDALAASIAYLYCDDADLTLVTAAVDRIDLLWDFTNTVADIRLRGMVTYVGKSSMEITMLIELDKASLQSPSSSSMCQPQESTEATPQWDLGALAKFLFVARSEDGKRAITVPRLIAETKGEQELVRLGKERHQYRLRRDECSLFQQPPTAAESQLLHGLLIRNNQAKDKEVPVIPMRQTAVTSMLLCHPQDRNVHNFIFGGYLMREAFELAYTAAILHTRGQSISIVTVEDINFVHAVPVGSLLKFSARIVCTDHSESLKSSDQSESDIWKMQVEVIADVINPSKGNSVTTNTFHYTFATRAPIMAVIPETYKEAMCYLEGKRRMQISHSDKQSTD